MDCDNARLLLSLFANHPDDLEPSEAEPIARHCAACQACAAYAARERRQDLRFRAAMADIPEPAGLQDRIRARLVATRSPWYRRIPREHPRWAALAASVVLLMGWGAYAFLKPLPILDGVFQVEDANAQVAARPGQVEAWFAEHGLHTKAPADLNYAFLVAYAPEELHGVVVPRLLFERDQNRATVYVLSSSKFNRRAILEQPRVGSGIYAIEFRPHPDDSRQAYFYMIRYTGGSLDWLLGSDRTVPAA